MTEQPMVDVSQYENNFSLGNKIGRALWSVVWALLFRPSFTRCFAWRRFLLRLFGAKIGAKVDVYPSCRVWAPWNLEMDEYSCMSHYVDCYCVDKIKIGRHATVSQYSHLCTATHNIEDPKMKLTTAPISIGESAWICAGAYIAPGVNVGNGAVAGARAVVIKNIETLSVVGGNPAKLIRKREIKRT